MLELGFRTLAGHRYQVDRSNGKPGEWSPRGDPMQASDKFTVVRPATDSGEVAFFRIRSLD